MPGAPAPLEAAPAAAAPAGPVGSRTLPAVPPRQQALWDTPAFNDVETHVDGEDELLDEAIKAVREMKKASISLLQRRLRIGYTRAARLIDVLEEKGIIGPAESGAKPREVINFGSAEGDAAQSGAEATAGSQAAPDKRIWSGE